MRRKHRKQRELALVALSAAALFLLMGVTFALSPVLPYLFEDGGPVSPDASLDAGVSSSGAGSFQGGEDPADADPTTAGQGRLLGAIDFPEIDLSVLVSTATASAPGEADEPDEVEGPSKTDKAEKPGKTDEAEKPSKTEETERPSKADETQKPDEAEKPNKAEKPSEADAPDEAEGPSEADEPGDTDVPSEPDEPDVGEDTGAAAPQAPAQQDVNGQSYVSLSAYAQSVDPAASVSWNGWAMTVTAGGTSVAAANGQVYMIANDRYLYIPGGAKVIDGDLYVPDSVAGKAFSGLQSGDSFYDQEALFWLSRIIYRESGSQSLEGQMAVGNVILNRVADSDFPSTIEGVLAQKNQFPSYASGVLQQTTPSASSVIAAKLVLDGGVVGATRGATYFSSNSNSWAAQNKRYIATFGGHNFYG